MANGDLPLILSTRIQGPVLEIESCSLSGGLANAACEEFLPVGVSTVCLSWWR